MKKIAVVGAGVFGSTIAVKLAENGFSVNLYEKESDVLMAASGSNQFRLHRGYHYPRSVETALSSKRAESSFMSLYTDAVISRHSHYYCIAQEKSKTSPEAFLDFCNQCGLEYKEVSMPLVNQDHVALTVLSKEYVINPLKLRSIIKEHIHTSGVNLLLNTEFIPSKTEEYDFVVNATYAHLNSVLNTPSGKREYQFELCEKPLFKLPLQFQSVSLVVLDGPFTCIDPYDDSGYHVMGNVVHAIHATNIGELPIIPPQFETIVNKGLIKNPPVTRAKDFLEAAEYFMPGISDAEHIGSFFTIRTVLPHVDATDERPTLVYPITNKLINVFSGKMGNCVEAAEQVLSLIKNN